MMSREKQIEEMDCKKCLHYEMCLDNFREAKKEGLWELMDEEEYFTHADECDFYAVAYRKQSEWISVDERLPENELERVLVMLKDIPFCDHIGRPKVDTDRYIDGRWVRWGRAITHWMPLPEAPKGGAE